MRVVIVGGGVGGLVCAQRLAKSAPGIQVQLIDQRLRHDFAPSFLWVLTGARTPARVRRPLAPLSRAGVKLTEARVTELDVAAGRLTTSTGNVPYDRLVLAPGARMAPELVPGLDDAAHGFYELEAAERLRDALSAFKGGRVLIAVTAAPFRCPAAPYEAAFLIEDALRRRGVPAQVDIATVEPQPLPVAGPTLGAQVADLLSRRHIGYTTGRTLESVDADRHEARFSDGTEPYDLLIAIPPHRAPEFIAQSSLAGPQGWIPVDPATLNATEAIHAIGDVTAIALANGLMLPKAGVFAHAQGETVARNLADAAAGRPQRAHFDGHGACFLETGAGKAGMARGNFYATPAPAVRMRQPARRWHLGKVLFERRWLARLR